MEEVLMLEQADCFMPLVEFWGQIILMECRTLERRGEGTTILTANQQMAELLLDPLLGMTEEMDWRCKTER